MLPVAVLRLLSLSLSPTVTDFFCHCHGSLHYCLYRLCISGRSDIPEGLPAVQPALSCLCKYVPRAPAVCELSVSCLTSHWLDALWVSIILSEQQNSREPECLGSTMDTPVTCHMGWLSITRHPIHIFFYLYSLIKSPNLGCVKWPFTLHPQGPVHV